MTIINKIISGFWISLFFLLAGYTQDFKWQQDEKLTYGVDWTFIRLGEIHLSNVGKEQINGIETNHIKLVIKSNPLLFWLKNESVYDSYITDSLKVMRFISDEKVDDKLYNAVYNFDYDEQKIQLSLIDKENPANNKQKIIPMKPNLYDGISLIYYARMNSLFAKKDTVSTFIEDKSGNVLFNFLNKKEKTNIDSLDEKVKTIYFDGTLAVTGIAGVTGPFEAWFSRDAYRVPVLAYLEVFIGSVKISLERWNHWQPPL